MKTLAPTLTISLFFYGTLLLLISSFTLDFESNMDEPVNSGSNLQEVVFDFEEENYINDIPFDTKSIADDYFQNETKER